MMALLHKKSRRIHKSYQLARQEAVKRAKQLWSSFKIMFAIRVALRKFRGDALDTRVMTSVKDVCRTSTTVLNPTMHELAV
jgi:hypothetical protein